MVRLYVSVQQELDVERFRTELTLELFGMTGQVLFHVGLRVERGVTHQAPQHLLGRKQSKTRYGRLSRGEVGARRLTRLVCCGCCGCGCGGGGGDLAE